MDRYARTNHHERITAHLQNDGVDVNQRYGARKNTLLMIAASKCSFETMEVLLRHGAAQDLQNNNGETALMIITKGSKVLGINGPTNHNDHDLQPIRLLLDYGANLLDYRTTLDLQTNRRKETALMIAAQSGRVDICELLMNAGADTQLRNAHGTSAEDLLLKALPRSRLILQNRTPTLPTSVESPILSDHQIPQTEEDHLYAIIKSIDTVFAFKIVFTFLTYQYQTNYVLTFDEYKDYVFKALDHTAPKCISTQFNEVGAFLNCLDYAIEKNLINDTQNENLIIKASNCDIIIQNEVQNKVHQRIDNLVRCLERMQEDNLTMIPGIEFAKSIIDIFPLGLSGSFAEVIMDCDFSNIIDLGCIEHVQNAIRNNTTALQYFNSGLEYAEDHFFCDSLHENMYETLKEKNYKRLGCVLKLSQMQIEIDETNLDTSQGYGYG